MPLPFLQEGFTLNRQQMVFRSPGGSRPCRPSAARAAAQEAL